MDRRFRILATAYLLLGATGCSFPVTKNSVQSFDVRTGREDRATAFNRITGILIDRGFDIKASVADAGIITTEYKKFASVGDSPPFDYYLQIKTSIRDAPDGQILVRLSPTVKEQNRLNAAAFTEHELTYYTGEPDNVRLIQSMRPGGWRVEAQTLFMNVVSDVAELAGVSVDQVDRNVTTTPENAFVAK